MKLRSLLVLFAVMVATIAMLVPTTARAEPTLVGFDDPADWGINLDPTLPPVGDALGQELEWAWIDAGDGVVNFVIGVKSLPPTGGFPEASRYVWDMNVVTPTNPEGKFVELDGKFTNYSRGACDPTAGQCPPPRDPGLQPFLVRGNCTTQSGVTLCEELGIVQGVFDPAAKTITIPVPLSFLGGTECPQKVTPGVNPFGGSISASPAAFFSSSAMPMDTMDLGFGEEGDGDFVVC